MEVLTPATKVDVANIAFEGWKDVSRPFTESEFLKDSFDGITDYKLQTCETCLL